MVLRIAYDPASRRSSRFRDVEHQFVPSIAGAALRLEDRATALRDGGGINPLCAGRAPPVRTSRRRTRRSGRSSPTPTAPGSPPRNSSVGPIVA